MTWDPVERNASFIMCKGCRMCAECKDEWPEIGTVGAGAGKGTGWRRSKRGEKHRGASTTCRVAQMRAYEQNLKQHRKLPGCMVQCYCAWCAWNDMRACIPAVLIVDPGMHDEEPTNCQEGGCTESQRQGKRLQAEEDNPVRNKQGWVNVKILYGLMRKVHAGRSPGASVDMWPFLANPHCSLTFNRPLPLLMESQQYRLFEVGWPQLEGFEALCLPGMRSLGPLVAIWRCRKCSCDAYTITACSNLMMETP
eukprot:scaffold48765_cov18-Tisochrysis_lutea.AAC.1